MEPALFALRPTFDRMRRSSPRGCLLIANLFADGLQNCPGLRLNGTMTQRKLTEKWQFAGTERRRSRTYRAVGYTTAPVLKTGWATGPMPLRKQRNARLSL
jgi:hypothetical protein